MSLAWHVPSGSARPMMHAGAWRIAGWRLLRGQLDDLSTSEAPLNALLNNHFLSARDLIRCSRTVLPASRATGPGPRR